MKNEQGASLTILSVTIIVLIILAGVSFAMLVGDNGLFVSENTEIENNAKKEINMALDMIKKEAITKVTENAEILEFYSTIDLNKYKLNTEEGYKLITPEGKDAKGISKDGVIAIKYENIEEAVVVTGKIDFKIETEDSENKDTSGSPYGTIEKAH